MSNYCSLDNDQRIHIKGLVKFLVNDMLSAGGDGDAFWYSKYYSIDQLEPIIDEYLNSINWFQHGGTKSKDDKNLDYKRWQESFHISNDEEFWKNIPVWAQVKIAY